VTTTTAAPPTGAGVERPSSVGEAAQVLRDTTGTVLFRGGGTKMAWGGTPAVGGLVLETGALCRLLSHNPADMTVRVEAGMPLHALQEQLSSDGQWLALDPPTEGGGATVGGLLATGDFGPRRLRYGAVRDLVIGVTLVLADGTVARAGGQVIKNVAGYDLSKLAYGSLGTLALVAEVALRVHPRPQASATVVVETSLQDAAGGSLRLLGSPLEPSAVDWAGDPRAATGRLAVRFEGSDAGVAAQVAACRELLTESRAPLEQLSDSAESALWDGLAAEWRGQPGQTVAFAGTLASRSITVGAALGEAGEAAGARVRLVSHVALGLHTAHFGGDPVAQASAFGRWRDAVLNAGGTVLLRERPEAVDAIVDAVGPPPAAAALLRAVKSRLDPHGRLAPGRLGSWL